jgi:hypothetical protein
MSFEKPSINDRGVTELPDANSSSSTPPTEDSTTIDIKPTITESPSPEAPKLPHDYGIGPVPGKPDACTGGIARENRGSESSTPQGNAKCEMRSADFRRLPPHHHYRL